MLQHVEWAFVSMFFFRKKNCFQVWSRHVKEHAGYVASRICFMCTSWSNTLMSVAVCHVAPCFLWCRTCVLEMSSVVHVGHGHVAFLNVWESVMWQLKKKKKRKKHLFTKDKHVFQVFRQGTSHKPNTGLSITWSYRVSFFNSNNFVLPWRPLWIQPRILRKGWEMLTCHLEDKEQ